MASDTADRAAGAGGGRAGRTGAAGNATTRAVQSVRRAGQLLGLFTPLRTEWGVGHLARATGLHKSVVTRLMATLALDGFVVQDPITKTYTIGPQAFAVGTAYRPYTILNRVARPVMQDMSERCGYAVSLGVPAGDKAIYVAVTEGTRPVRVVADVGERRDYHANAIGKVLLASFAEEEVRRLAQPGPLPKLTPHTIDSVDHLLGELAEVRRTGVAYNRGEAVDGVGAVAVPITNANGVCLAAISIPYPIQLVTEQEVEEFVVIAREGAAEISQALGALTLSDHPPVSRDGVAETRPDRGTSPYGRLPLTNVGTSSPIR